MYNRVELVNDSLEKIWSIWLRQHLVEKGSLLALELLTTSVPSCVLSRTWGEGLLADVIMRKAIFVGVSIPHMDAVIAVLFSSVFRVYANFSSFLHRVLSMASQAHGCVEQVPSGPNAKRIIRELLNIVMIVFITNSTIVARKR